MIVGIPETRKSQNRSISVCLFERFFFFIEKKSSILSKIVFFFLLMTYQMTKGGPLGAKKGKKRSLLTRDKCVKKSRVLSKFALCKTLFARHN